MGEKRIVDYFSVIGLSDSQLCDETINADDSNFVVEEECRPPITDIGVIFPSLGEHLPEDYEIIEKTPSGLSADLNHGSLRSIECYLCFKRGRDKPPLVDIGVMYDGKERLMFDAEVVKESVGNHSANINNALPQTLITYRRGGYSMPCNALVVTDICVVITNKGEIPPHAFCCINKNLNRGMVGSDVFLCYKKSTNRRRHLIYKPTVITRYPIVDHSDFPFPNSVPLFCLPIGASIESWSTEMTRPKPVFSMFVLTVSDAKFKIYGSALTFYELIDPALLSEKHKELLGYTDDCVISVNKSICILSHWPFSDAFEKWLHFLYCSAGKNSSISIPLERYIVQLVDEVPFPSPRTLLELSTDIAKRVIFIQPEDLPLPRSAAGFRHLLLNLGSDNCLLVLLLALTEQKILIHSLRPDILTAVAEAVTTLLFPFKWQCPYIPLCPLDLVEVLHAPLPFLIGVHSQFFDVFDPPNEVTCIDLDTNIITIAESQKPVINLKLLPRKPTKLLKANLEYLQNQIKNESFANCNNNTDVEIEFNKKEKEQAQELQIQEAFLRFMVLTLKGYRSYLLPITKAPTVGTTDPQALFQMNDFLKSRDKSYQKFFQLLMKTQMFIRFIEERSFVTDDDQGLTFFDECFERLLNDEVNARLIEPEMLNKNDRTLFVLPPEPSSPGRTFTYDKFALDSTMFYKNRENVVRNSILKIIPGSPMIRRTKHEINTAKKLARKYLQSPDLRARCLSGTCHTLYFMTLPSIILLNSGKETNVLQEAYDLLLRTTHQRLECDEVCYRLMMQLCSEYSRPLLAVKLLVLMKKFGIQPNALTYGLYNRCILAAEWSTNFNKSQLMWNKLRNLVWGVAQFRSALKRKLPTVNSKPNETYLIEQGDHSISTSSELFSQTENSLFNKFRKVANIVRDSLNVSQQSINILTGNTTPIKSDIVSSHSDLSNEIGDAPDTTVPPTKDNDIDSTLNLQAHSNECQLEDTTLHNCVDNMWRQSPGRMSARMLVTQNDPLGALDSLSSTAIQNMVTPKTIQETLDGSVITSNDENAIVVPRSSTFIDNIEQSKIQRSETAPAATTISSLANFGSNLKFGFSPNNFKSRKSNEFLQGGISTLKSAATSVVKKIDEIKEAISTSNSTPLKAFRTNKFASGDSRDGNFSCKSLNWSDPNDLHRDHILGNCTNYVNCLDVDEALPDCFFPFNNESQPEGEIQVNITSCSQCHHCLCLLYDEDIMANWLADDSNLNTICISCDKPTVPLLTVNTTHKSVILTDRFSVPYLNPLVLRKELENLLSQEGDICLTNTKFVNNHPIIYWNLVWVFERINVDSHLVYLYLDMKYRSHLDRLKSMESIDKSAHNDTDSNVMQPVEKGTDPLTKAFVTIEQLTESVNVKCYWDEMQFHTSDDPPMYRLWDAIHITKHNITANTNITKSFMEKIIDKIYQNDLNEPITMLATVRANVHHDNVEKGQSNITRSLYRDILFLACEAIGRSNLNLNAFDKQYALAFSGVLEKNKDSYGPQDKPISLSALYCRQYFRPLSLP